MKTSHPPPGIDARGVAPKKILKAPPGFVHGSAEHSIDQSLLTTSISINADEEEELSLLGLSRDGSLLQDELTDGGGSITNSHHHSITSLSSNINPPGAISMHHHNNNNMVGINKKSAFPSTPAAPSSLQKHMMSMQQNNNNHHRGGGGAPIIRRTPGPGTMNIGHQARGRRTPGAGAQQQYHVSILCICLNVLFFSISYYYDSSS